MFQPLIFRGVVKVKAAPFLLAFSGGWFLVCPGGGSCAPIAPGTGHSAVVGGCGQCMLQWDEGRWQACHWCFVFWMDLPTWSLTYPLKSYLPNRKVVFQPPFFRVYVKLWGCIYLYIQLWIFWWTDFFWGIPQFAKVHPSYGCFFFFGIVESWTDNRNGFRVFFTGCYSTKKKHLLLRRFISGKPLRLRSSVMTFSFVSGSWSPTRRLSGSFDPWFWSYGSSGLEIGSRLPPWSK